MTEPITADAYFAQHQDEISPMVPATPAKRVKAGDPAVIHKANGTVDLHGRAPADGYMIRPARDMARYVSDQEFEKTMTILKPATAAAPDAGSRLSAAFGGAATPNNSSILVAHKAEPAADAIVLKEPVTFAFISETYTAPAGSVLYRNPADEDGFTLTDASNMGKPGAETARDNKPVAAADFFAENKGKVEKFMPAALARFAEKGSPIIATSGFVGVQSKAPEHGYTVTDYSKSGSTFYTIKEFEEKFTVGRRLDPGAEANANYNQNLRRKDAELFSKYGTRYMGPVNEAKEERIAVFPKDQKPVKGIVLDKPMTFTFKEGNVRAEPGDILYKNPKDPDGFTLVSKNDAEMGFSKLPAAATTPGNSPKTKKNTGPAGKF